MRLGRRVAHAGPGRARSAAWPRTSTGRVGPRVTCRFAVMGRFAVMFAFRRFAPRKLRPHITDVMRTQKNAVMLWTVTPPLDEQNTVFGCLKG